MKKTMKKILCLALVLMMTLPFAAFPVNADSTFTPYDEAEDGDELYAVDFRGTSGVYEPVDGRSGQWYSVNPQVAADGKSVTVQYTETQADGTDPAPGNSKAKARARFCSKMMDDFSVKGKSYTVQFTLDSETYVGIHLDGNTGFIINPSTNSTYVGQGENMSQIGGAQTYEGTSNSKQTYAIEMSVSDTLTKNYADYDVYAPTAYKLYVLDETTQTWKLVRTLDENGFKRFEFEYSGEDENYAYFYLSINCYGKATNVDENGDPITATVSDMKIYKGIEILDYYTPDEPEQPSSYESLFSEVKLQGYTNAGNEFGFGDNTPGSDAIDGVLHDSNGYAGSANYNNLTKNTFFDGNGQIACNVGNGNYYGVIIAELKELTILDTFTVWTPNGLQSTWFDNVAYDIYYSIDGKSFAPVDSASFDDVRDDAHYEAVNESDFLGEEATSGISDGEFAGKIYKNEIPMNGVTAKYVAIAVKETLPKEDSTKKQIVLYEITATGTSTNMCLENGASVRMDDPTGLRFTGLVDKSYFDGLTAQYGTENVKMGMLITPTDYLTDNGLEFTKEALDGCNAKYLEIDAAEETVKEDGDYYKIKCVIAKIKEQNHDRAFSAILYVKITEGEDVTYIYSDYNEVFNSRSVAEVAEAAYYDLKDAQDATYKNEITVDVLGEATTKYSPYTVEQRETLYNFFGQGEQ